MRAAHLIVPLVVAGCALAALAGAQANPAVATALEKGYGVQARPAYEGNTRQGDTLLVVVQIENLGADSRGMIVIRAQGDQNSLRYPIALPRGAKKSISVPIAPLSGAQIVLETDRGAFEIPFAHASQVARASLLAVGDGSGGLAFLEQFEVPRSPTTPEVSAPGGYRSSTEIRMPVAVSYAKPEMVPESEAELDRLSSIALLSGSERLNERQMAAIRRYVLRGGHLVLVGGASAPVLTDPRIRDLVPYSGLQPGEVVVSRREVSIQRPVPIPGARSVTTEAVPIVRRDYGLGRVTMLSADPVEGELAQSPLRKRIVNRAMDLQRASQNVRTTMERGPNVVPAAVALPPQPGEIDPFDLKIPPTTSILIVLGAYFIVVLPVNFLVLRAFRRLELAWFTAPLLAVGFAGLLFRNAGSLYSTGLSSASQSTIIAASGQSEGLAMGMSQIFYPQATRGPIPIPGAEAISTDLFRPMSEDGYYNRRPTTRGLDVFITDGPAIPDYASTALEFRDVEYRQVVDLGRGIRVIGSRLGASGAEASVTVENGSPYALRQLQVVYGPTSSPRTLGTEEPLPAGGRIVLRRSVGLLGPGSAVGIAGRDVPMLVATVDDAPVGPAMGKRITTRMSTRIVVSGEVR